MAAEDHPSALPKLVTSEVPDPPFEHPPDPGPLQGRSTSLRDGLRPLLTLLRRTLMLRYGFGSPSGS